MELARRQLCGGSPPRESPLRSLSTHDESCPPMSTHVHPLSFSVSLFFFFALALSLRLSVSPSLRLSVSPSLRLSVSPSLRLSVSPSLCLSRWPSRSRSSLSLRRGAAAEGGGRRGSDDRGLKGAPQERGPAKVRGKGREQKDKTTAARQHLSATLLQKQCTELSAETAETREAHVSAAQESSTAACQRGIDAASAPEDILQARFQRGLQLRASSALRL